MSYSDSLEVMTKKRIQREVEEEVEEVVEEAVVVPATPRLPPAREVMPRKPSRG